MKTKILNYLKADRSFSAGVALYMEYGNSLSLKTTLNRQGHSDYNHRLLLEELSKLAGITSEVFSSILSKPVTKAAIMEVAAAEAAQVAVTPEEKEKFITEIPEQVRKSIRLRDQFPFLSAPDCPQQFKILVHDMLTAYSSYVDSHKRLFEAVTDEELQQAASGVVENYLDNREVWEELDYFQKTGKILGKHMIFTMQDRITEIAAMATPDLVKLQKNLMNNLARKKKDIQDNPEHKNTAERKASVAKWEIELVQVNKLLGLDAKTV